MQFNKKSIALSLVGVLGAGVLGAVMANGIDIKEEIDINSPTMDAIVFADSNLSEMEAVEAEVVFVPEIVSDIETSMQIAISEVSNQFIEQKEEELRIEKERKIAEEKARKEAEAKRAAYRASIANNIIEERNGAIFSYNPFVKSGLTVEQYNKILAGSGLAGCGQSYYNMENTYGVNGLFAIGVAFNESGRGWKKANTNNFYGMRGSKGWMSFESPDANIQYFGKLMNKGLYKGKSMLGIAKIYCPGTSEQWVSIVKSLMRSSFNKI